MPRPQFRLFTGNGGKLYFTLTAKNAQVILTSQGYGNKASALNGVKAVKGAAKRKNLFERKTAAGTPLVGGPRNTRGPSHCSAGRSRS